MRADVSQLVHRARSFSAGGCQKAVVASLPDCLRRVPELGPFFCNDHPNCGSMEPRRSSRFLWMLLFPASSAQFLLALLQERRKQSALVTPRQRLKKRLRIPNRGVGTDWACLIGTSKLLLPLRLGLSSQSLEPASIRFELMESGREFILLSRMGVLSST